MVAAFDVVMSRAACPRARSMGELSVRRTVKRILTGAALIPALAAALLAGTAGAANAIANGDPVPDGQYRFAVKLTMTGIPTADGGRRNSACSGSLIAPQWVITAGHCFRTFDGVRVEYPVADLTTATVGRTDLTGTGGHVVKVIAVRQSATADVALAKIETPVTDITPIRVGRQAPAVGSVIRVTGYGSLTSTNPVPVDRLRTGQLTVLSLSQSVIGLHGYAPKPDTTPCPYDSGAPYFLEKRLLDRTAYPTLVGVVSDGPSCPHTSVESAARTDNLYGWIFGIVAPTSNDG
jgi:V8-like Glu-specific endopeptidase